MSVQSTYGRPNVDERKQPRTISGGSWVGIVVAISVLLVLPAVLPRTYSTVATQVWLTGMGAVSLTVLAGVAGKMSLGNSAFMAVGAVTAATITSTVQLPFLVTVAVAGIVGALFGFIVGLPASRLTGMYLAIITLAFHFIVMYAFEEIQKHEVGFAGWSLPAVTLPLGQNPALAWHTASLVMLIATISLFHLLLKSNIGRKWHAVKENEPLLEASGVAVAPTVLAVFSLTSAVISVQGAVFAYQVGNVHYESFGLHQALTYLVIVFVGGVGSAFGALLGTVFIVAVPYLLRGLHGLLPQGSPVAEWYGQNIFAIELVLFGAAVLLVLLIRPGGLISLWPTRLSESARSQVRLSRESGAR